MMRPIALKAGSGYYYYLEREAIEEAYWQGRGAELLQLEWQVVRAKEFSDLMQRIDPNTGEELKPRCGQRITLYDAVVHAPKSVSILSVIDDQVVGAHRAATTDLMSAMENQASVWADGRNLPTGNMIMAAYEHRQSRAADIHLHTHVAIINLSYDSQAGEWKALRSQPIFFHRHDLTERYRECLAKRLENIGYEVADKERVGFEIAGVPKETIERYSQRSQEIKKELQKENDLITVSNVGRWTRRGEKEVFAPDEFREWMMRRLSRSEREQIRGVVEQANEHRSRARYRLRISDDAHDEGPREKTWDYGERISL